MGKVDTRTIDHIIRQKGALGGGVQKRQKPYEAIKIHQIRNLGDLDSNLGWSPRAGQPTS